MTFLDERRPAAWREAKETQIRRELARHVKARSTDMSHAARTIPPEVYTDPVRWDAERRDIFLKLPMLACLSQEIPEPGNMVVFEAAGPSILVVRGKDRQVRAFLNMCMHRAAKLVKDCSRRTRLSCPFHAWTYSIDGKLIGVPRREAFDAEDLADRNLVPMPVGEWGGMVFVKATPGDEKIDVEAHLGDFADTIRSIELDLASPVIDGRLDFAANWKYALDTYNEGYHIAVLHAKAVGAMYYGDLLVVERHGRHHRQSFATNEFSATLSTPESEWDALPFSPSFFIFPNISINRQPMSGGRAWIQVQRVYSGDEVGKGFALVSTYNVGGPLSDEDKAEYLAGHELIMQVVGEEDFSVSKGGYDNLRHAPAGFAPVFGRNEHPAYDVETFIADAIGMPFDDAQ